MHTNQRDLTWFLKWAATAVLLIGTVVNSAGIYPLGVYILTFGGLLWLTVSIRWREASLIVVNASMTLATIGGLLWKYYQG